jgi:hypothetical protein
LLAWVVEEPSRNTRDSLVAKAAVLAREVDYPSDVDGSAND